METYLKSTPCQINEQEDPRTVVESIIDFYNEATVDYAYWSSNFNMHYGYLANWKQFFHREQMLEEMNAQVLKRMELKLDQHANIVDMGCGVGATSRHIARTSSKWIVAGINIVREHIEKGNTLNRKENLADQINFHLANYQHVQLPDEHADGICAVESMCHSLDQKQFLNECHRILKKGSRLVITDCFRKTSGPVKNLISAKAYEAFKKNWRVELANISQIKIWLKALGFTNIQVEDKRFKVAPSVFHSPFVVLRFFIQEWLKGKKVGRENLKNIKAVLQSIPIGLDNHNFSYFIVSATKPK